VQDNLTRTWTVLAILLGTGGLLSQTRGGAAIFTLSLPVTRAELMKTRAVTALAELLALALIPSLAVPLLSPLIGQSYSVADTLVHALCVFVGGTVFFSLAMLLSTVFSDVWRPALLACGIAVAMAFTELALLNGAPYGIFGAMNAESYFRSGSLPWQGLLVSAAASAAMLYAAALNVNQLEV
jgi:ABC-type transport system involved in multi-copper enzyme maturation permease subunit